MALISFLGVILLLLLVVITALAWYLFFRFSFRSPTIPSEEQLQTCNDIPYLLEHGLPYPAGIGDTSRETILLDGVWRFFCEEFPEITEMEVPGCFNTADSPMRDYQGEVWYEREIKLPIWTPGSLVRLGFMGSFYRTEVYLDEKQVCSHEGGYLPFFVDITEFVEAEKTHRLKVKVDNRLDAHSLPPHLFEGHNVGWHPYGGLHRSVVIEFCPEIYCFKLKTRTTFTIDDGGVHITALFQYLGDVKPKELECGIRLLSNNGEVLVEKDAKVYWDWDQEFGSLSQRFNIGEVDLWTPNTPNLYRVELETPYEVVSTSFGFTDFMNFGGKFLLNFQPVFLAGVCRHQEDREHGLAQPPVSVLHELETVQSLNANFVRLAHYPHSSETLDMCDRLGLLTWVEIPLYQAGLGVIRYLFDKTERDTGKKWASLPKIIWDTRNLGGHTLLLKARKAMLKMIERDCNHPAIVFWGLGNECWSHNPAAAKALGWLREQAETLETGRMYTYAGFAIPTLGTLFEQAFEVTDVVSVNQYFGWYYGSTQEVGSYLNALALRYPDKLLLVTETGADTVRGQHSSEMPPERYSEEFQIKYYQEQWQQMQTVPTFGGLSLWVLKDFLCPEYREDNPVPFYNLKGLLDRDGEPKAAFDTIKEIYGEENNPRDAQGEIGA